MNKNVVLAALGGAAAGVAIANYLSSDKGRQLLISANGTIHELKGRATEFAKQNIPGMSQNKDVVQPS